MKLAFAEIEEPGQHAKPVEPALTPPIILNEWAARDLGATRGADRFARLLLLA